MNIIQRFERTVKNKIDPFRQFDERDRNYSKKQLVAALILVDESASFVQLSGGQVIRAGQKHNLLRPHAAQMIDHSVYQGGACANPPEIGLNIQFSHLSNRVAIA